MFVDINVKLHNISVTKTYGVKDERVLKLMCDFRKTHFYKELLSVIYEVSDDKVADQAV